MDLQASNDYLLKLLEKGEPFFISRLGMGPETILTKEYLEKGLDGKIVGTSMDCTGIYSKSGDISKFVEFAKAYNNAVENSSAIACLKGGGWFTPYQDFFLKKYRLDSLSYQVLEPFYCCEEGIVPWTLSLKGKKILIVNSFVESMKKQLANKFQMFKDKKIFHDDQEFVFYKSYQTISGNYLHSDWSETFALMCKDIEALDFDIALLGCGGYGLPLCDFIKTKLGKSAVYIGGGIQLLFGIMGSRWEKSPFWTKIIAENDPKFIRPSGDEICPNNHRVDGGGSYW
jgi:hypothetical protein